MTTDRQEANFALLALLLQEVDDHPDLRFGQLLWNLGILMPGSSGNILDAHAEESTVTLRRVQQRLEVTKQGSDPPD
ncbi:hypothetical protein [Deinococcus sp. 6GRE01]|uniref:hypothetical protein n=1 Tax=Deinococcus sp. 6GRE01 TaxID=2745873 RepID=UPI001E39D89C|nr:hypothetical protein [Deinococcus sp. 6GRE01]MCD0156690.1 hypothetical protein [Deinococcus sp. 6GRE01]